MQTIISLSMWVSLPNEVRYRIRGLFNIPRSSNTIVSDGRIESDGTTNEDMKQLTVEKMQEYLDSSSTDFHKLFDEVVARVNDEIKLSKSGKSDEVLNANPTTDVKKSKKGKK